MWLDDASTASVSILVPSEDILGIRLASGPASRDHLHHPTLFHNVTHNLHPRHQLRLLVHQIQAVQRLVKQRSSSDARRRGFRQGNRSQGPKDQDQGGMAG